MPSFPRDTKVLPTGMSGISVPGPLQTVSQSRVVNTRSTIAAGRTWSETFEMLRAGDPTVENFLSFLRRSWNRGLVFTIKHLQTPGSGEPPNGLGTSGVQVNGGGQTGDTISTTGWPASTSDVVVAGDMISIDGVGPTLEIYQNSDSDTDGNATLYINPPIFAGSAPADLAAVTTTGVQLNATLRSEPNIPDVTNAFYYSGIELNFIEVPNA